MSQGAVEFDVATARAELNRKCDTAPPVDNNACGGERSAADLGGRKDAEGELMDCFFGGITDINQNAMCDREIVARNTTASNSATIQVTSFTEKPSGDQGEDGSENNCDSPRRDSSPASRFKAARDDDDDFRLGNIHATVRSDLLITHGISDEDTVYLIKREETRETEDFWLKIDRAKNKNQFSSLSKRREDSKAVVGRAEEEPQKEVRRLGDDTNMQTSTSLSARQSQAISGRHDKAADPSAPNCRKLPDLHDRTEDDNNSPKILSDKHSPSESRKAINVSGSTVPCLDETQSLPKRALRLLRGVRRNGSQGYDGGSGKNEEQKRPQKGEKRLPDAGKNIDSQGNVDARLFDAVDTRSDLPDQGDFNSSIFSTPTENELRSRPGGQQAGTEEEELKSLHISPLVQEVTSAELPVKSTGLPHRVHLPSITKTNTVSGQTGPPPALVALALRGGLDEVQTDSARLRRHSVHAVGEWKAVQAPQVANTAPETDEAAIKLGSIIKRTLQRQGNAHISEMPSASLATAQSQTRSEIMPNHEHKGKNERADQEGAILLGEELQEQQEETSPQKEPKQWRAHLHKRGDQRQVELHGDSHLSSSTAPLPLQHQQLHEKQHQWAGSEKGGLLTDSVAYSSQEGTAVGKNDSSEKKIGIHDNPVARGGTSEEFADAHRLTIRLAQLWRTSRHINRQEEQEEDKEKQNVREAKNRMERRESSSFDRWSAVPQVTEMSSDDKKRHSSNLSPGRRHTQASEYTEVDLSTCRKTDEEEMKELLPYESRSSPRRFLEEFAPIRGFTSANTDRDNTVEVPQTLTGGDSPTSVRLSCVPVQTCTGEEQRFIRGGKELRGANGCQAGGNHEGLSRLAKTACQEEFGWLYTTGGGCELEGCAVQNVLQKQQAKESWFLSKDHDQARRKNNQWGGRSPNTWSAGDTRPGDTRKGDKAQFPLRRRSDTSKSHRRKSKSQDRELEVMLQHLLGNRLEPYGNRRNKGAAEIPMKQERWMRDQLKEIKDPKAVNMKRWISGFRSSRLQRLSSSAAQTKIDPDVRRLLRVIMRGGGHHTDELADRWLNNSSSDESSYRKKRICKHEVGKPLRTAYQGNPAEQHRESQTCTEEEKTSQSSSGTSRGWINLENNDLQEEDVDQCLLEKEAFPPHDMRKGVSFICECTVNSNSSSNAGGLETAASYSPVEALSAAAPVTGGCVRLDSNGSGKEPNCSSRRHDGKRSSIQIGGSSLSSHPRTRRCKAVLPQKDDTFEKVKESKSAGTSTSGWSYDDCAMSSNRQPDGERTVDHKDIRATSGVYKEYMPVPRPQDSPSSSSVCSSRVGWETLDTELAFPTLQMPECETQAVRASEGEPPREAETHALSSVWQQALRTHEVVHKGAGAVHRSAAEDTQEEGKQGESTGAGQWKYAPLKKGNWKETEADKTHQEEAPSGDNSNSFLTTEENDAGTEGRSAPFICSESRAQQPSGISLLRLFGTAVGGWNFLNMGWKKQDDREKKEVRVSEDVPYGEAGKDKSPFSGRSLASSAETCSFETIGKPNLLRGTSSRDKRMLKLYGKRSLAACRRQCKRSTSNRRIRTKGVISKDGPGGGGRHEIGRSGRRIDRGRNISRGRQGLCSNSNTPASSGSVVWGSNRNGSRYRRSGSSSMVHSTSGSVCRSVSSKRHQTATGSSYASSNEAEEHTHTGVTHGRNVDQYTTLSTADTPWKRWLEAGVRTRKEFLQPRATSLHSFSTSVHSCRTRCPPAGRTGTKHRHLGATVSRRPTNKVAVNTPLKKFSFCDWHRRGGRVLLKHLEKELGYREFPTRREGRRHVAKQATMHMLRVRTRQNSGTSGARRAPLSESRSNRGHRMASLGSKSSTQVEGSTSPRTDSNSKSSNDTCGYMRGRPPWTLFRTSAALREGSTFQSSSGHLMTFPGVSPLSAAAHMYGTSAFCPAAAAGVFSNAAPFSAVATPLFATGAQMGYFKSPVYVSRIADGCAPRLTASPVGAALPTEGAGVAHTQSARAVAGRVSGTTLLFTRSFRGSSSTANGHTGTETCATATNTSPFWYSWPAAVLRVVGLPLRCVVQVLGLNVSGAFDRWREEIRQRSLRGFLTLCLLDGVVCAAAVWGVCHLAVFASRAAFRAAYLHVHSIDTERASHYFDGLTYRFWGKRPLYFTDNPLLGAGRAADAEIATDPWSGLHPLQQRGIAWYQHHMYGDL